MSFEFTLTPIQIKLAATKTKEEILNTAAYWSDRGVTSLIHSVSPDRTYNERQAAKEDARLCMYKETLARKMIKYAKAA